MVRIFLKGGVWKNSEDEILKAAVMKYGKQQWSRVASLLNRKSAKQCKSRWEEWLDPSVKKVEWSRDEEEKLLHLAKLMPAQWRTISPLVGRTASQCQEKYEALLDAAHEGIDENELNDDDDEDGSGKSNSAKMLRQGEVDTHPETRPARPDPIDMDEDEIEMLQEARARLANTQGKKAKRKGREKMLGEAKRLGDLQKRRELKEAGLLSKDAKVSSKKRKEMDYGVEIPFHKLAPSGFHDVTDEVVQSKLIQSKHQSDIDFGKVNEMNMRNRDKETLATQKKDAARMKQLEKANMQLVVAQVSQSNDPLAFRARGVLKMPSANVSDAELESVSKMARHNDSTNMLPSSSSSSSATNALIADYTNKALPTPMRTPHSQLPGHGRGDVIMQESRNIRALNSQNTPLLGQTNKELEGGGAGVVYSGQTYGREGGGMSTVLENGNNGGADGDTPMIGAGAANCGGESSSSSSSYGGSIMGGARARDSSSVSGTPQITNLSNRRDLYNLNAANKHPPLPSKGTESEGEGEGEFNDTASFSSYASSIRAEGRNDRRKAKKAKLNLVNALKMIPEPIYEYELGIPEEDEDEQENDDDEETSTSTSKAANADRSIEEDQEEIEARMREIQRLEEEEDNAKRSSVVKRADMAPRPANVVIDDGVSVSASASDASAVREEMIKLLKYDGYKHPTYSSSSSSSSSNKKRKAIENQAQPATLDNISLPKLEAARLLLSNEGSLQMTADATRLNITMSELSTLVTNESITAAKNSIYVSAEKGWIKSEDGTISDIVDSIKHEYASIEGRNELITKKITKIANKLDIKLGGYAVKCSRKRKDVQALVVQISNAEIEVAVYGRLSLQEKLACVERVKGLSEEVRVVGERVKGAQGVYETLVREGEGKREGEE